MPKKARDYINEQGWKIAGALAIAGLLFLIALPYNKAVKAQEAAQAAVTKAVSVEQQVSTMGGHAKTMAGAAEKMEASMTVLQKLVTQHDKDLALNDLKIKTAERRLDKLEK